MSGPSLKKSFDDYSSDDFINLSQKDFFKQFGKDNKGVDPRLLMGKQQEFIDEFKKRKATAIEDKRSAREDQLNKQYEGLKKLLTSRPGRGTGLLT